MEIESAPMESEWTKFTEDYVVGGDEGSDSDTSLDFNSEWVDVNDRLGYDQPNSNDDDGAVPLAILTTTNDNKDNQQNK